MRISQFSIKNFRNFKNVSIEPKKINGYDLIVLIGENNTGKTNVLSMLHYLFNPDKSIRIIHFTESDFFDITQPIEVNISFDSLSEEILAQFETLVEYKKLNGVDYYWLSLTFTCNYDPKTKDIDPRLVYSKNDQLISFAEKQIFSVYFQDALRDSRALKPTGGSLFQRIMKQIDISQQESDILKKLEEAGAILKNNNEIDQFTKDVLKITRRIIDLEKDGDALQLSVATSDASDLKKFIQFQVKQPVTNFFLDIDELGLGLQSVLTLSIFRAFAGIGKLKEGIFSIDEPEAHLHPQAQRAMYKEILALSKHRQIWIATHSPSLLELIDPRQYVLIKKLITSESLSIQLPADFSDVYVKQYEKHLDIGKSEAFFSRATILVEGPTEHGLFPSIGSNYAKTKSPNYDLDRISVSVINVGGKNNLKAMARLLKNFGIPLHIVIDYDPTDSKHETVLQEIKQENEHVFEIPRDIDMSDIEGYTCRHVPVKNMLQFLQEVMPEYIDMMFSELKGAIKPFDEVKSNEIKTIRQSGGELIHIIPILQNVMDENDAAEGYIKRKLATFLRKIKGRTTGRLLGEYFHEYFPKEFINILDNVACLAGFDTSEKHKDDEDEMSEGA